MEKETCTTSPVFRPWIGGAKQNPANSISTSVFSDDAANSSAEVPVQHVQREGQIQHVQRQKQEEIPRSAFSLYARPQEWHQMMHAPHHQHLPVSQPAACNWCQQAVHIQPLANISQLMYVMDSRNVQLVASSQTPILVPAWQLPTIAVVAPQQLHVQPVVEYGGTPGVIPYPVLVHSAVNYVDVQQSVSRATGQFGAGYVVHSLPPVDQRHPEAAPGVPITATCKKECGVTQAGVGPAVSEYQIAPPLSANTPKKIGARPSKKKQGSIKAPGVRKEYACPYCGRKFTNRGQLTGHVRCHTGERPYGCQYEGCEKKFARKEELTRHIKIHTQEKTHQCLFCEKRFGRMDHCKSHMLSVHGRRK